MVELTNQLGPRAPDEMFCEVAVVMKKLSGWQIPKNNENRSEKCDENLMFKKKKCFVIILI